MPPHPLPLAGKVGVKVVEGEDSAAAKEVAAKEAGREEETEVDSAVGKEEAKAVVDLEVVGLEVVMEKAKEEAELVLLERDPLAEPEKSVVLWYVVVNSQFVTKNDESTKPFVNFLTQFSRTFRQHSSEFFRVRQGSSGFVRIHQNSPELRIR